MATLVLGLAGQAVGNALLPAGINVLGQTITGAAIGGAVGAYAGMQVDAMLRGSARMEGPRLKELHVQASSPGAFVPRVWGAARLAGQVIWAARFRETQERHGGGKSGPRVTQYRYTASFAVGLCEGVIGGVGRIWADGKPLALEGVTMRVYRGTEDQMPDPSIVGVEGAARAPAYRGLAYVVFEDLALEPFGNRVPQLSFEVMRPVEGAADTLEQAVEAVCLIPGAGEFVLATGKVLRDLGRGAWAAENVNNTSGRTNIELSLDQLQAALPNVKRVALVVTWFGDDLRCGLCRIRPGVEQHLKRTVGGAWSVAGIAREDAYVVSDDEGRPNFGGTPSDASVRQAIAALKSRGMEVTLYPFIMMDLPAGNGLPDPYGAGEQGAFPWRGRISVAPAPGRLGSPDKSAAAASDVAAFFDGAWGLRRMVTHYAALAAEAGGVDAFLIGSELRGVTTVRDGAGSYPAVAKLKALAGEVRAILGPGTAISYAADWTEWRGHDAADGSGDFHFHLDPLWTDENVDFIGIDWYAPLTDWRDGALHADAALGDAITDAAVLQAGIEGGEDYDWYYASEEDRAAQVRSAISDGAYGKPWTWRAKDVRGWWSHAHVNRAGGVETTPTAWAPGMKPVRFTEIGCPAVDKGSNQPNVFYDPRSSESALPRFSSGVRDDQIQRRMLEAFHSYWREAGRNPVSGVYGGPMIDMGRAHVWAWDARPFPDWPLREEVWSDGPLWRTGHWLNGRAGAAPLGEMVREICARAGVGDIDVTGLRGACAGYALDRVMSAREALSPLMTAFAFEAAESGGRVRFFHSGSGGETALDAEDLAEPEDGASAEVRLTRREATGLPGAAKAVYVDAVADYRQAAVEARLNGGAPAGIAMVALPLSLTRGEAEAVAKRVLHEAWGAREQARFALPPSLMRLEPGDAVTLTIDGQARSFRLTQIAEAGRMLAEAGRLDRTLYAGGAAILEGGAGAAAAAFGPPVVALMDLPALATAGTEEGLCVAAFAEPWPGRVSVLRAATADGPYTEVVRLTRRAVTGETATALPRAAPHEWDRTGSVEVTLYGGTLAAASERDVLDGANRAAVETGDGVWEVMQFAEAELVGPSRWRLSGLLRGQAGTEGAMADVLAAGARFVLLDEAVARMPGGAEMQGAHWVLRVGPAGASPDDVAFAGLEAGYAAAGRLPFAPAHVSAVRDGGDVRLSWVRRARDDAGAWSELEVTLGEEAERYVLEILDGDVVKRRADVDEAAFVYDAAMQAADWGGAAPPPLAVRVAQVSPRFGVRPWRQAMLGM
ncbi:MAG: glycoside hydrolase/phage tail family protein [Micropepsaceae bacterium]